jgi:hypothetical protein
VGVQFGVQVGCLPTIVSRIRDRVALIVHGKEGLAKKEEAQKDKVQKPRKRAVIDEDNEQDEEVVSAGKYKKANAVVSDQAEHNALAVGKWNVDCEDCEMLEIRKGARYSELRGDAVVNNCNVKLHCSDIEPKEMVFKAVFKTQKTDYLGQMRITVEGKNKLSVFYNNGGKGRSLIVFNAIATRARK